MLRVSNPLHAAEARTGCCHLSASRTQRLWYPAASVIQVHTSEQALQQKQPVGGMRRQRAADVSAQALQQGGAHAEQAAAAVGRLACAQLRHVTPDLRLLGLGRRLAVGPSLAGLQIVGGISREQGSEARSMFRV